MPMTMGFPKNTEMEAELTFVREPGTPGGGAGGGGGATPFFEGVPEVAATGEAASIRVHHTILELPDSSYTPRVLDPRAGYFGISYEDFAAPLGVPMTKRFIARHRLDKKDPSAGQSTRPCQAWPMSSIGSSGRSGRSKRQRRTKEKFPAPSST